MTKTIVVINGAGGVGKDTLISFVQKKYTVWNISSIVPIKQAARKLGWADNKDDKSRKFLSDLKRLSVEYNNYPLMHIQKNAGQFLNNNVQIMFVHIREPQEIRKFVNTSKSRVVTLLIRRKAIKHTFGNESDDDVENYDYDYVYDNDKPLEEAEVDFMDFFENKILRRNGAKNEHN